MPRAEKQPSDFPTTRWSLIGEALDDGTTVRATAIEELVVRYRPPLLAHLILRKRLNEPLAEDLLQGFITEKIFEQYLLRHADQSKGKFRSLLVRSLENYHLDWIRKQARQAAPAGDSFLADAVVDETTVSAAFEVAWARQLFQEVLDLMRRDCEAAGQVDIWGVFACRLLGPLYERCKPPAYEEVCRRFNFQSPEQAGNALVTAKRKFQRAFEKVAARYQHDGETAEDVLRELKTILAETGPLEWRETESLVPSASDAAGDLGCESDESQPARMAQFLDLPSEADALWCAEDLAGLMAHQLAQSLTDLNLDCVDKGGHIPQVPGETAPLVTLADLFRHPEPPLEVLESVKRFGRKRAQGSNTSMPSEIASALYFASIAAALVRSDQRISKSYDELLRYGFQRLLERPWIAAPLRELFEQALAVSVPGPG